MSRFTCYLPQRAFAATGRGDGKLRLIRYAYDGDFQALYSEGTLCAPSIHQEALQVVWNPYALQRILGHNISGLS